MCVSELNRVQYREWSYGAKNKAITLYMGTQIHEPSYSKLEARDLLQIPKNEYVITNVSAIEAIKGIDLIIKAVSLLKQKGLNVLKDNPAKIDLRFLNLFLYFTSHPLSAHSCFTASK